jgi:hypothetical protein
VRADELDAVVGNPLYELSYQFVLLHPPANLRKKGLGDVDTAAFLPLRLEAQEVGVMRRAGSAFAARVAAPAVDAAEGGGDEGADRGEAPELGVKADLEAGHGTPPGTYIGYYRYIPL